MGIKNKQKKYSIKATRERILLRPKTMDHFNDVLMKATLFLV